MNADEIELLKEKYPITSRLREMGRNLGNAIAGYRDNNLQQSAKGLANAAATALDAADEIERLEARCEAYKGQVWAGSNEIKRLEAALLLSHRAIEMTGHRLDELEADNARLRAALREAFRAGFWAAVGPANEAEYAELTNDEQGAWMARAALNGEKE